MHIINLHIFVCSIKKPTCKTRTLWTQVFCVCGKKSKNHGTKNTKNLIFFNFVVKYETTNIIYIFFLKVQIRFAVPQIEFAVSKRNFKMNLQFFLVFSEFFYFRYLGPNNYIFYNLKFIFYCPKLRTMFYPDCKCF